jgi:hypothetical protein
MGIGLERQALQVDKIQISPSTKNANSATPIVPVLVFEEMMTKVRTH